MSNKFKKFYCVKGNSEYWGHETDSKLELCYYHAWITDKIYPSNEELEFWLRENKICTSSIEHCKKMMIKNV